MRFKDLFRGSQRRAAEEGGGGAMAEVLRRGEKRTHLRQLRDSRRRSAPGGLRLRPAPSDLLFVAPATGFNERPIDCPDNFTPKAASLRGSTEVRGPKSAQMTTQPNPQPSPHPSKEDFRKEFVSGLWSIKPIRLHLADVGTNTSREESGYATSSNAHTPPSSSSSPHFDTPPNYTPPPPPLSSPPTSVPTTAASPPPYERLNEVEEHVATFNSYFERSAMISPTLPSSSPLQSQPPPLSPGQTASSPSQPSPSPSLSDLPTDRPPEKPPTSRRAQSQPPPLPPPDLIREDVSVGSLYQRIDFLAGLIRDSGPKDWERTLAFEEELEQLYARLPTLPLHASPKPRPHQPLTLRQKKNKSANKERRRSRWDEEWEDEDYETIVGIDIGTSNTRCAFAVRGDPLIYAVTSFALTSARMKKREWCLREEEGERGSPSCLLLGPDGSFRSFGLPARRRYHDLDPADARRHLYFENFKANIVLRGFQEPGLESCIQAASGRFVPALDVFAHLLRHLRHAALRAIAHHNTTSPLHTDALLKPPDPHKIKWVILVPFFWSQEAKNFMREAAYHGSLGSASRAGQVMVTMSPESSALFVLRHFSDQGDGTLRPNRMGTLLSPRSGKPPHTQLLPGETMVILDCGGGSVEGGVYQVCEDGASVCETQPPLGGPRGDLAVDLGLEILLCEIFGANFIKSYQNAYPLTWLELMGTFGARKLGLNPLHSASLNITIPASFASVFAKSGRKIKLPVAVKNFGDPNITYTEQGVLRLGSACIQRLFQPTVAGIVKFVEEILAGMPVTTRPSLKSLFLVGAFAHSPILQHALNKAFNHRLQVAVPSDCGFASVKGAVIYARSTLCIASRASYLSYGIGVLHPFDASIHPSGKRVEKGGSVWCVDVYDPLVRVGEVLRRGHTVLRRYCPASPAQAEILLQLYASEAPTPPAFVTDAGVRKAGQLRIRLPALPDSAPPPDPDSSKIVHNREVEVRIVFGLTELAAHVVQVHTGKFLPCDITFS